MAVQDQMATVGQVCRRQVDLIDADETTWDAAERMLQCQVDILVAVDSQQRPTGLVSGRLLAVEVIAAERSARTTRVREVMAKVTDTIPETATAYWALLLLLEKNVGCLPVVDEEGRLVGLLALDDILRSLKKIVKPLVEDPS